jgi:hypothetical protein
VREDLSELVGGAVGVAATQDVGVGGCLGRGVVVVGFPPSLRRLTVFQVEVASRQTLNNSADRRPPSGSNERYPTDPANVLSLAATNGGVLPSRPPNFRDTTTGSVRCTSTNDQTISQFLVIDDTTMTSELRR